MAYAILRTKKIKTKGHLNNTSAHNNRSNCPKNADEKKKHLNKCLSGSLDALSSVYNRYDDTNATIRKNGVIAVEVLLTASPQFFKKKKKKQVDDFCKKAEAFLQEEFGHDNVVSCILHLDEITPHVHAIVTPLELKAKGRFKGQWRQNAKNWLGGREKMSGLQDRFAKKMSVLGLERGIKGSTARHQRVSQYYSFLNDIVSIKKGNFEIAKPPLFSRDKYFSNLKEQLSPIFQTAKKVSNVQKENKKLKRQVEMLQEKLKELSNRVRDIPLEDVLKELGYDQDLYNKKKFKIHEHSSIIVNGMKWYDHHFSQEKGGGGAIDLVMHACNFDFKQAVSWLADRFSGGAAEAAIVSKKRSEAKHQVKQILSENKPFVAPINFPEHWPAVRNYLVNTRKIDPDLIDAGYKAGCIYATKYKNFVNAVFYDGKETAELSGIGDIKYKILAPGSKKTESGFTVGKGKTLVLVESAIDALSYYELADNKKEIRVVSTAGSSKNMAFVQKAYLKKEKIVYAGDNDKAGDTFFRKINEMCAETVERQKPKLQDYNDDLKFLKSLASEEEQNLDSELKFVPRS